MKNDAVRVRLDSDMLDWIDSQDKSRSEVIRKSLYESMNGEQKGTNVPIDFEGFKTEILNEIRSFKINYKAVHQDLAGINQILRLLPAANETKKPKRLRDFFKK